MFRYFTFKNTRRYIDVIDDIVHNYDKTYHRTNKCRPVNVKKSNEKEIFKNIYGVRSNSEILKLPKRIPEIKVGDSVRLQYLPKTFDKGYYPQWTEEVFKVKDYASKQNNQQYKVMDWNKEDIKGSFYKPEIQRIIEPKVHAIEKIIDTRKKGNKTEYFVKWLGYSEVLKSWIPAHQMKTAKALQTHL